MKELGEELQISVEELRSSDRSWRISKVRTMIAYIVVRRQGYRLGEVARYLGRDMATVGTLLGRLAERMQTDGELRKEMERLSKKVEI